MILRYNILGYPMLQIITHPPLILDFFDAWKWVKLHSSNIVYLQAVLFGRIINSFFWQHIVFFHTSFSHHFMSVSQNETSWECWEEFVKIFRFLSWHKNSHRYHSFVLRINKGQKSNWALLKKPISGQF